MTPKRMKPKQTRGSRRNRALRLKGMTIADMEAAYKLRASQLAVEAELARSVRESMRLPEIIMGPVR